MGDAGAFREMFDRHFDRVRKYVARRAGSSELDDLVAEVFTVAWRRRDVVPDEPDTLPWLLVTARNVVANHRRAAARRAGLVAMVGLPLTPVEDPSVQLCADTELRDALMLLASTDRQVLLLSAWDGLSGPQIAAVMGLSVNAVHLRLSRARRRLGTLLAKSGAISALPVTDSNAPGHIYGGERDG